VAVAEAVSWFVLVLVIPAPRRNWLLLDLSIGTVLLDGRIIFEFCCCLTFHPTSGAFPLASGTA
jgi:hypothetical protein